MSWFEPAYASQFDAHGLTFKKNGRVTLIYATYPRAKLLSLPRVRLPELKKDGEGGQNAENQYNDPGGSAPPAMM